eukprot:TRINITY_DN2132_c0_g3_i1.p6 TRINITY_DN2132_c0_g3~~TRINITY_DN2132_c0_g3_i1.p6  ORF type:complete len:125 (+),score=2.99 TRINITY_DN2132_c0_g3_i1:70-444(+)
MSPNNKPIFHINFQTQNFNKNKRFSPIDSTILLYKPTPQKTYKHSLINLTSRPSILEVFLLVTTIQQHKPLCNPKLDFKKQNEKNKVERQKNKKEERKLQQKQLLYIVDNNHKRSSPRFFQRFE